MYQRKVFFDNVFMQMVVARWMETTQGKIVMSFLGLPQSSRNTPLFSVLSIPPTLLSMAISALNLLNSCFLDPEYRMRLFRQPFASVCPCDEDNLLHDQVSTAIQVGQVNVFPMPWMQVTHQF